MKIVIYFSTLFALAFHPQIAYSDCSPDSVGAGGAVVCVGNDPDGFDDNSDNITINVELGASVTSSTDDTINTNGNSVELSNHGSISSTSDRGVDIKGNNSKVDNSGTITGDRAGIRIGDGAEITNLGLIVSTNGGAIDGEEDELFRNNVTIINSSDGEIRSDEGGGKAIRAGARLTVTNYGTIESASSEAIEAKGANLTVRNEGKIIAISNDAIDASTQAEVRNFSLIQTDLDDAIELDDGLIVNNREGEIISNSPESGDYAIDFDFEPSNREGRVVNRGYIEGMKGIGTDDDNVGVQIIINSGKILGRSGIAVSLGQGDDIVCVRRGGQFDGRIVGGDGNDTFHLALGASGTFQIESFEVLDIRGSHTLNNDTLVVHGIGSGRNTSQPLMPVVNPSPCS